MIAVYISTAVEVVLILLLGWGAAYVLQTSYIFRDVVWAVAQFYPFSPTQVYVLIFLLVSMLGVFLVFAFNTKGLRWYIIPLVAMCIPSTVSHSGLPEYFARRFGITLDALDINILQSTIDLEILLMMVLLLVAGFVVLYNMISLRAMSSHLSWRGVDDEDVVNAYKGRSVAIVSIVLVAIGISYLVSHYTRYIRERFESLLNLEPLIFLVIGVAAGFAAVAIILTVLVIQRPKMVPPLVQPKHFTHKAAKEAKAVLHMFVPSALTRPVGRWMVSISRPLIQVGRSIKSSRRFHAFISFFRKGR